MQFLTKIFNFKKLHYFIVTFAEWDKYQDASEYYVPRGVKVKKGEIIQLSRISLNGSQLDKKKYYEITKKKFAPGRKSLVKMKKLSFSERTKAYLSAYVDASHQGELTMTEKARKVMNGGK